MVNKKLEFTVIFFIVIFYQLINKNIALKYSVPMKNAVSLVCVHSTKPRVWLPKETLSMALY